MAAFNQLHNANASMASNAVVHTSLILDCSQPFPKHSRQNMHHRLMKQTLYKLQTVFKLSSTNSNTACMT